MQEHCRETHDWQNPSSAGRPSSGTETTVELPRRDGVYCQRFFTSRAGSRWFEVGQKAKVPRKQPGVTRSSIATLSGLPDKPSSLTPEAYAHVKAVMEREERYHRVENQPRNSSKVLGRQSFSSTSLWLEQTRWHLTFRDSRRDILRALTQLPNRRSLDADFVIGQGYEDGDPGIISASINEQKIACIIGAMDPVLDRCEQTVRHTSRSLLCWLRSNQISSCHNKEFALVAEESGRQWYRTFWKRFLAFVLRVCRMDNRLQRETNLTARVRMLTFFESIWRHHVWNFVDTSKGIWRNSAVREEITADAAIDQSNVANWIADKSCQTWQGHDSNHKHADIAEADSDDDGEVTDDDAYSDNGELYNEGSDDSGYASDVHDQDCHGVQLRNDHAEDNGTAMSAYTEFLELLFQFNVILITEPFIDGLPDSTMLFKFSGILGFSSDSRRFLLAREYCPRLSPLIYIQRVLFLELALPIQPYKTAGIPPRPHVDQLRRLNEVRGTYMVTGSQSSFAELVSLRDACRNISRTEPPAFILRWSDDGSIVHFYYDL